MERMRIMKHAIARSLALALSAALLAGCSNEQHNTNARCSCWTDGLASWGQDIYFGRYQPCFSDGHGVPITFPTNCNYYGDTMATAATMHPMVTVSGGTTATGAITPGGTYSGSLTPGSTSTGVITPGPANSTVHP